jgi:flagellar motility protein MotE (MotC chaperone)
MLFLVYDFLGSI